MVQFAVLASLPEMTLLAGPAFTSFNIQVYLLWIQPRWVVLKPLEKVCSTGMPFYNAGYRTAIHGRFSSEVIHRHWLISLEYRLRVYHHTL